MANGGLMRGVLGASAVAALLTLAVPSANGQQARSSCGTDQQVQTQVLETIRAILASSESEDVDLRDRLGISNLAPEAAALVSDPRVCARAAQRINWLAGDQRRDRLVYVVSLGEVRAVHDPSFQLGEWSPLVFFDSHWKVLETLLAF